MVTENLFEKYGGFSQINRIVISFYDALLDSDEVGHYFDDVQMDRLIDHQTKFVAFLLGGPANFSDEQLSRAHSRLGISDADFDEMKAIFRQTLVQHAMEAGDVAHVLDAVEERRGLVVDRQASSGEG